MATVARCLGIGLTAHGLALQHLARRPVLIARLGVVASTRYRAGASRLHLHLLLMHPQLEHPARFAAAPFAQWLSRALSSCGL